MSARDNARAGWDAAPGIGLSKPAAAIVAVVLGGLLAGLLQRAAEGVNRGLAQSDSADDIG